MHLPNRFLKTVSASALGLALTGCAAPWSPAAGNSSSRSGAPALYKISLAEWSLHRTLRSGKLDHLDFARTAKEDFGIDAVEYVNQFFMDEAENRAYLREMKRRAEDAGVESLLIMVDKEGVLGPPDRQDRIEAVQNHHKWVEAAAFLGCHSIRVNVVPTNAEVEASYEEQQQYAADGLRRLCEFAEDYDINVIVENHVISLLTPSGLPASLTSRSSARRHTTGLRQLLRRVGR